MMIAFEPLKFYLVERIKRALHYVYHENKLNLYIMDHFGGWEHFVFYIYAL